jgi:hypothetical protein
MNVYIAWFALVVALILVITLAWTLSFKVTGAEDCMDCLWKDHPSWLILYICLILSIVIISILMLYSSQTVKFDPPLAPAPLFLLAASVLLLSNFFVGPAPKPGRNVDRHPLLFYTTTFFLIMAVVYAGGSSLKNHLKLPGIEM